MLGEVKLSVFGLQVLGETRGHSVRSLPPRRSHSLVLGHAWCCIRGSRGAPGQRRHQSFVSCLRPVPGGRNCGGSLPFLPLLWSCWQPAIPACSPGVSSKPDLGQCCAVGEAVIRDMAFPSPGAVVVGMVVCRYLYKHVLCHVLL